MYGSDITADFDGYRACVHHPEIGYLWTSAGWPAPAVETAPAPIQARPARMRILVVSSGGVLNYGDDAILLSTLQRLRRIRPDALVSVVSDGERCPSLGRSAAWINTSREFSCGLDPAAVREGCQTHPEIIDELSKWLNLGSCRQADLKGFDAVVFAGGGNLAIYWPSLIAWRTAIAAAATAAGIPYIISGQGVGPISDELIPMISFFVRHARAVATRDIPSLHLLERIAPNGPRMHMIGYDALGMQFESPEVARNRLAEIGVPLDLPLLGFHAREASYVGLSRAELAETARRVDDLAADHGFVVVGVPINMQPHAPEVELLADLAYGSGPRRAPWHIVNHAGDIGAIAGTIKACSRLLTHSYHGAIFALENRIPTLLFAHTEYYRLKAEALRTAFGIPVSIAAPLDRDSRSLATGLDAVCRSSWSRGMTGEHIDAWMDEVLPR
jgi:polysaccharide pyruvyl transferase WcaK-like protein